MNEATNPLLRLEAFGQSVWLDYLRRDLIVSGGLMRLIKEDGVRGVTSNPSIFEKAIGESPAYEREIRAMALTGQQSGTVNLRLQFSTWMRPADVPADMPVAGSKAAEPKTGDSPNGATHDGANGTGNGEGE
jgi:hypothetical protein